MSIREFASPVSSPPFFYTPSGLYVEVEGQRKSRCSSARLYDLLTYQDPGPAYTKAGNLKVHQPPKHRDETQAFYVAQCIHYGLEQRKSKPAAKKALLTAIEGSESDLTVPASIRNIERKLAAEYDVKNAAAEKVYREQRLAEQKAKEQESKKRKQEEAELMNEVLEQSSSKKPKISRKKLDIKSLAGSYVVAAPAISDGWDCGGPLTLDLAPSSTTSHLWGAFDFGVFEGTLRSTSSVKPGSTEIEFSWRGRETGEGESTYGDENVVNLTFLGNGTFKGTMHWNCCGDFDLVGRQDKDVAEGTVGPSDQVDTWKEEYWSLNDANYERERVGRWGGYWRGGYEDEDEDEEDGESNSDTDN